MGTRALLLRSIVLVMSYMRRCLNVSPISFHGLLNKSVVDAEKSKGRSTRECWRRTIWSCFVWGLITVGPWLCLLSAIVHHSRLATSIVSTRWTRLNASRRLLASLWWAMDIYGYQSLVFYRRHKVYLVYINATIYLRATWRFEMGSCRLALQGHLASCFCIWSVGQAVSYPASFCWPLQICFPALYAKPVWLFFLHGLKEF